MLDEPAMSVEYSTGQKMTGTTNIAEVKYRKFSVNKAYSRNGAILCSPAAVLGGVR